MKWNAGMKTRISLIFCHHSSLPDLNSWQDSHQPHQTQTPALKKTGLDYHSGKAVALSENDYL